MENAQDQKQYSVIFTRALGKKVNIELASELASELAENSVDVVLLNNDNVPEIMSTLVKLLVMILPAMKDDGIMIIRIFDTVSRPMCQLIFYLTMFFDIELIKPRISRRTNSEKFIVATGFGNTSINSTDQLKRVLEHCNEDNFIRSLGVNIPTAVENILFKYNNGLVSNQCMCIEKTLSISSENEQFIEQLETFQNTNSMIFCNAFGIKTGFDDLGCKHQKRKKINSGLKMLYMCEKCFIFLRP
jgi:FtsJ-like methyltransferase